MAALENEQGYAADGELGPALAPYPGYVQTDADRRRWNVAYDIAVHASALMEESGEPDARATWYGTRALYSSDTPTGAAELAEADDLSEAATIDQTDGEPLESDEYQVSAHDRATELIAAAYAAAEHDDMASAEQLSVEALDVMFGDPDGLPDLPGRVEEAQFGHIVGTYTESKHPRGRAGKWTNGLAKIKNAVTGGHLDAHAGARMNQAVAGSTFKGPARHTAERKLPESARRARDAGVIAKRTGKPVEAIHATVSKHLDAAKAHVSAKAEVAAKGLRGGTKLPLPPKKVGPVHSGRALAHMHRALIAENPLDAHADKLEKKGGLKNEALAVGAEMASFAFPDPREAFAGKTPAQGEDVRGEIDQAHEWGMKAMEVSRWAHEHEAHIRITGHLLKHAAKAIGLYGADDSDE